MDVLVLNASYEPMAKIDWQRAVILVVGGKAVIEEAVEGKLVRHKHGSIPWPKVIRLIRYVKIPFTYSEVPWTRYGVLKRDNYRCCYCGKRAETVEHILPTSRGGHPRSWENTAACCARCNHRKGDKTVEEAHLELLFEPTVPMQFTRVRGGRGKRKR